MPTERLRALLTELHDELEETQSIDAEGTQLLRGIKDEINELIETEAQQREAKGIYGRLEESVRRFEESHPQLTSLIQRISDTLSQAGI